jgi:GntR family transcriptional repressor for pyruvate dehydrogenase complex
MRAENEGTEIETPLSLVPETASDSAVRFLRAMIFSGELGPGDRLPPERDLGARLGISRMTLRLALKALESTGYIVTTRGSRGGSRVADESSLLECWNQWMRQHLGELGDIFELRTTVETRLAALAAERRSDADLEAMERALARERVSQDWSSLFRTDMDIHKSIARAARSPRLERVMMAARGDLFIPVNLRHLEGREPQVHETHTAILEAIRDRDPSAAAKRMRQHVEQVRKLVDRAVEESGISRAWL